MGLDECMKEAQVVSDQNIALKLAMDELGPDRGSTQQGGSTNVQKKSNFEAALKNVVILDKGETVKREAPTGNC